MRKIGTISASHAAWPGVASIEPASRRDEHAAEIGHALIVIDPPSESEYNRAAVGRLFVPFLAHLIATERKVPQTRTLRRSSPQDATAAYDVEATKKRRAGVSSLRLSA